MKENSAYASLDSSAPMALFSVCKQQLQHEYAHAEHHPQYMQAPVEYAEPPAEYAEPVEYAEPAVEYAEPAADYAEQNVEYADPAVDYGQQQEYAEGQQEYADTNQEVDPNADYEGVVYSEPPPETNAHMGMEESEPAAADMIAAVTEAVTG
ncbi:MAG: hypothetical protein SGPRY_010730 [Prymnesium sp.]